MHFENREDYIKWATIMLLASMDMRVDTTALENAQRLAQQAADLFFQRGESSSPRGARSDPYQDPPAVRAPPGVRTVGPQVPGQKTTLPAEDQGNG
jgi:hypothetical protein